MKLQISSFNVYTLWQISGNPTRIRSVPESFINKDIDITFKNLGVRIKNTDSKTTMKGTNQYLIQLNISKDDFVFNNPPFRINRGSDYFKTSKRNIDIIREALYRVNIKIKYLY